MTSPMPQPGLPRGRRLGVDLGDARIGVAVSDPDGLLATPVETIVRKQSLNLGLAELSTIIGEYDVQIMYIGLPRLLSGHEGTAASGVRSYAEVIQAEHATLEIRLIDERLTTVSAHQALRAAGRDTRQHRAVVDQQAAVEILQGALDTERHRGRRAGELFQQSLPSNRKLENG